MSLLELVPADQLDGMSATELPPATPSPSAPVDWTTPRILALAVMSSAFTGQAIALGFDRKYGAFKRLAMTALPLWVIVCGRLAAALVIMTLQVLVIGGVAALLGWAPEASGLPMALVLLTAGTLSFGALGVLLGGALRAEVVLALANLVWFALLLAGGIVLAPDALPSGLATVAELLPSGALAEGLRSALVDGVAAWDAVGVLAAWGVVAGALATRTTKLT